MSKPRVVGIFYYPVKGMRGIETSAHAIDHVGLRDDRRYMLVDPDGKYVTQRECPALAAYSCSTSDQQRPPSRWLHIFDERNPSSIHVHGMSRMKEGERAQIAMQDRMVDVIVQDPELNDRISKMLGRPVRLVYLPDSSRRPSRGQREGSENETLTSLADGYPFLLTSVESLNELNTRLRGRGVAETTEDRFRPNIVVEGCDDVDTLLEFKIGDVTFYGMKRCARCSVILVNQKTGEPTKKEPLATLATYRRFDNEVCFGMNLNHEGRGMIHVGDELEIIRRGEPPIRNGATP